MQLKNKEKQFKMGRGSSQGDLPEPGIKPASSLKSRALAGGFFTTSTTWEAPKG